MNWMIALIILMVLVELGLTIYRRGNVAKLSNQATRLMLEGKFQELNDYVDSKPFARNFPLYNRLFLKLNAAMLQDSRPKVVEIMREMEQIKMVQKQKAAYYSLLIQYFMIHNAKNETRKYIDLLAQLPKQEARVAMVERSYKIIYENDNSFKEELEQELKDHPQKTQLNAYLLIQIYQRLNDQEKVQYYTNMIQEAVGKYAQK